MSGVLFISYNSHQADFFKILKKEMSTNQQAYHLKDTEIFIKGLFSRSKQNFDIDSEFVFDYTFNKFLAYKDKNKRKATKFIYKKYLKFKAKCMKKFLYNFCKQKQINLVVVWNGASLEVRTGIKIAELLEMNVVYLETGYFPRTLVVDPQGVNANSSLKNKGRSFYRQIKTKEEKLKNLKNLGLEQRPLRKKETIVEENIRLPDKFIFLPFQVHTDSQILSNSPYIDNMDQLLEITYSALQEFNENNDTDYWLVAKEHPSDYGRIDYISLKEKYQNKKVIFLTTTSAEKLIEWSQLVVTINSTVGIESLLKETPVITLGKASYNIKGVVFHYQPQKRLAGLIEEALYKGPDWNLVDKFLYYLRYDYLVEIDKENPDKDNIKNVIKEINRYLN